MKRTITGRTGTGPMTLGDLRQFLASLEGLPDQATVKARVGLVRKSLRSVTVVEDDDGFSEYIRAVGTEASGKDAGTRKAKEAKETTSA